MSHSRHRAGLITLTEKRYLNLHGLLFFVQDATFQGSSQLDYLSFDSKSLARLFVENPQTLVASIRAWIELDDFTGKRTKEWVDKRNNGLLLIDESVKLAKDLSAFIQKFSNEAPKLTYWLDDDADYLSEDECYQWDRDLRRYLEFFDKYLDLANCRPPKGKPSEKTVKRLQLPATLPFDLEPCDVPQTLKRKTFDPVTIANHDYWELMVALMKASPNAVPEFMLKQLFQSPSERKNHPRKLREIIGDLGLTISDWTLSELKT